jgi:hypothetical protein
MSAMAVVEGVVQLSRHTVGAVEVVLVCLVWAQTVPLAKLL